MSRKRSAAELLTYDGYASDSSSSSLEILDEDEWKRQRESTRATTISEEPPKPTLAVARSKNNYKRLGIARAPAQEGQKTTSKAKRTKLEEPSPEQREQQAPRKKSKVEVKKAPLTVEQWLERVETYARQTEEEFTIEELAGLEVEGTKSKHNYLIERGILKPFQLDGVRWIIQRHASVSGCILADEMGTGKTIQSISFLAFLRQNATMSVPDGQTSLHGANLIICPLAVLRNWEAEFAKWAPNMKVVVYHGDAKQRETILTEQLDPLFADPSLAFRRPTIITTFEMASKDKLLVNRTQGSQPRYEFQVLVVDEAQRIKNSESKTHLALQQIRAAFRLLLTGTPIQNNLQELQALLSFTLPEIFGDSSLFQRSFDFSALTSNSDAALSNSEKEGILVDRLKGILEPFMLRRLKTDVQKDLPLKKEYVLRAPMMPRQQELYEAVRDGFFKDLLLQEQNLPTLVKAPIVVDPTEAPIAERLQSRQVKGEPSKYIDLTADDSDDDFALPPEKDAETKKKEAAELARAVKLQRDRSTIMRQKHGSPVMSLRQIAFHPWLANPSGHPVPEGVDEEDTEHPAWKKYRKEVVAQSGKLQLLDRLLTKIMSTSGSKIIIFSQFTMALDLVGEWLRVCKDYEYFQLDGGNPVDQDDIDDFNTNKSSAAPRIFLVSTRAGGVGITLTGADTVILLDSDWNPQVDLQAMDRAHRIGQRKPVLVFRFETEHSIDGLIIERATTKRRLDALVLGKDSTSSAARDLFNPRTKRSKASGKLNLEGLAQRLKALEGDKIDFAAGGKIISDEQLDQILDRSPAVMRGDKVVEASSSKKKGKGKASASTKAVFEEVETIVLDEDSEDEGEVDRLFRV